MLIDGFTAHMMEKVVIPPYDKIHVVPRIQHNDSDKKLVHFKPNKNLVPPMIGFGQGYKIHATGLSHDENGYPDISPKNHNELIPRLVNKIRQNIQKITMTEQNFIEDAQTAVISYGISSRIAQKAVKQAREKNIKAGHLRLISLWPFPEEEVKTLAKRVKKIIVPEINMGQIVKEIQRVTPGDTQIVPLNNAGGEPVNEDMILKEIIT